MKKKKNLTKIFASSKASSNSFKYIIHILFIIYSPFDLSLEMYVFGFFQYFPLT